jgi:hydrogenase/urease accessory protein HupE
MLVVLLLAAPPADAHLMPPKQGTVNIVGDAAFAVLSVPLSALHGADDHGDRVLDLGELRRHLPELRAEVDRRFVISDGTTSGETVTVDLVLSPEHESPTDRAQHLVALKHVRFPAPPEHLRVSCDLFGRGPQETELTITATRHPASGLETEVAGLTPRLTEHRFFRSRCEMFREAVRFGVEHVLRGPDQLLLLLMILVAGSGWRYWLSVTTGFTVAQSLTLALAMLGVVRLPARVVEPAIALSLVLFALHNLLRRRSAPRETLALVFVCGLLHGLGFAGALSSLELDSAHRMLSLVGFNLGVEIGQALFLVVALAVLRSLSQRLERFRDTRDLPSTTNESRRGDGVHTKPVPARS